ncbi:MAG TPA: hypothetical protein VEU76_07300 [Candidatus Udaeobacter sp.]|nr:hypothetical protein [Candidatus Udaeobacter sp.]
MKPKTLRRILIGADAFAALSALSGGAMVTIGWPYQFPMSWLQGTPFSSYVVPGLILGLVVGGSATAATFATWKRPGAGSVISLIAGCIMAGWIVGEVLILAIYTWAQIVYLVNAAVMVVLAVRTAPAGWRGIARSVHLAGVR